MEFNIEDWQLAIHVAGGTVCFPFNHASYRVGNIIQHTHHLLIILHVRFIIFLILNQYLLDFIEIGVLLDLLEDGIDVIDVPKVHVHGEAEGCNKG